MAKELDKTTLTRLAWLTELRRQGHRQCVGVLFDEPRVCSLGLLAEVAGIANRRRTFDDAYYSEIATSAGLTRWQADEITARNDGIRVFGRKRRYHKHTFAEIADVVESWFRV